jgi:hypothetical protein
VEGGQDGGGGNTASILHHQVLECDSKLLSEFPFIGQ